MLVTDPISTKAKVAGTMNESSIVRVVSEISTWTSSTTRGPELTVNQKVPLPDPKV